MSKSDKDFQKIINNIGHSYFGNQHLPIKLLVEEINTILREDLLTKQIEKTIHSTNRTNNLKI